MLAAGVSALLVAALSATVALAGPTGSPPPGATAVCVDGTYRHSQHHSGTCSHHGGVATWLDGSSSSGSSNADTSGSSSEACGVERWTVKTLQDHPRLLHLRRTTIRFLVHRHPPAHLPTTRLPFERHVYRVIAKVTLARHEDDGDIHLVLRAGRWHMIAEAPSPSCDRHATRLRRRQIASARPARPRLRSRVGDRRRLLRFPSRPDRRRTERDRAASDPRLPLPPRLTDLSFASATAV